jgi:hypothetical protein
MRVAAKSKPEPPLSKPGEPESLQAKPQVSKISEPIQVHCISRCAARNMTLTKKERLTNNYIVELIKTQLI